MGFFDDVTSIVINNKEVQSIITSDGGVIYEKPSGWELVLTGDKSVMMTGETAVLTATLTNNNVGVSGETIYFDGILNSTSTTRTITDTETIVSSKYDVLTVPSIPDVLYLDKDEHIELTSYNGSIILTIDRVTTGQDISNISVDNGILSYTEEGSTTTIDISSYDLSVVRCSNDGTATIGDYGYYAVTDSNGVATVGYTGKGTGDLNIKSITANGIIQSEIFALEDCFYYDPCSSDNTSRYTLTNASLTYDSTNSCYILKNTATNTFGSALITNKTFRGSLEISADINMPFVDRSSNTQFAFKSNNLLSRFIITTGSGGSYTVRQITLSDQNYSDITKANVSINTNYWYNFKLIIDGGDATLTVKQGDTLIGTITGDVSSLLTTDNPFALLLGYSPTNQQAYVKNLKIKPL